MRFARSKSPSGVPGVPSARSRLEACGVPLAEGRSRGNRTEIISPANKQYKIALRAFHCLGEPLRAFQGLKPVPIALRAFQRISDGDNIGSYPVLPTNNTRIAANCCDITTLTSTVGKLLHAAYLECELRRIVCWLLIVSAEI